MRIKKQHKMSQKRRGILTFEWVLFFAVLTIGIIGGIAAMRDTVSLKFMQVGGAVGSLNTSYKVLEPTELNHDMVVPAMEYTSSTVTITPKEYTP